MRTTTDRKVYNVTDTAKLNNLVQNLSSNALIRGANLTLKVMTPNGATAFEASSELGNLPASAVRNAEFDFAFTNAPTGTYHAMAELHDTGGKLLATDSAQFDVTVQLDKAVSGTVTVQPDEAYIGDSVICTDTLTNRTSRSLSDLHIRQSVVSLAGGASVSQTEKKLDLDANGNQSFTRSVATAPLATGDYSCTLELKINGRWQPLAYAVFHLSVPPIVINSSFSQSGRGRVLILLDAPKRNGEGKITDDRDPHGPPFYPGLSDQRAWLENVLDENGWSYTIVTNAEDFAREFDTGGYALYALFSEQVKIPESVQHQLVAVVDGGAGLLVAGSHDRRNGRIEAALGIKSKGHDPHAQGFDVQPFGTYTGGGETFPLANKPLTIDPQGATALGTYRESGHGHGHGHGQTPALTFFTPTQGRSMFVGFDLLQQATAGDDGQLLRQLLTSSLAYSYPTALPPYAGSVLPLTIELENQGVSVAGRVVVTLPIGATVVDPGIGETDVQGQPVWNYSLGENSAKTWRFWVRMPSRAGVATFTAMIQTGQAPNFTLYATRQTSVTLVPRQ